jgi:hypothetical protein
MIDWRSGKRKGIREEEGREGRVGHDTGAKYSA